MTWFILIIFIISITLFLITKYYLLKKKIALEKQEHFTNESILTSSDKLLKYHNIQITYLDATDAEKLIVKDGEYLQGMNQSNLSARGCVNIDELYKKYKTAFDDISKDEKNTIDTFILKLLKELKGKNIFYYNYITKWLKTISIAKAKYWLESGMPHTLDTTIIMDAKWFKNPRKLTLVHEITHIHQRQSPLDFNDLYPLLGYEYNPIDIKGLEHIYPLNRNNPDGMDKYWLWQNKNNTYWWIGAIFKNAIPDSLVDVNMVALQLEKEIKQNTGDNNIYYYLNKEPIQLNKLTDFETFFGDNPNNYHPNEMTAKFAEWYLSEILSDSKNNTEEDTDNKYEKYEGYRIYKKYFENMLNVYYSR
jgi:hypothetical protein